MTFTKEMAKRLCTAVTHDELDCKMEPLWSKSKDTWQYHITWVFEDTDNRGKQRWWKFTITIPGRQPEEFEVHGNSGNPGYTHSISLQKSRKEEVRQRVEKELRKILDTSKDWQEEQQALFDEYVELHGG